MKSQPINGEYNKLLDQIALTHQEGRKSAIRAINAHHLLTYWEIGKNIVEFEQKGQSKAKYGSQLFEILAKGLSTIHGRGFSRSNITYMRLLYLHYPICETMSHKLSWSHRRTEK